MKPSLPFAIATATTLLALSAPVPGQDTFESLAEQALSRLAERVPSARSVGPLLPPMQAEAVAGALPEGVFIGVDDATVPAYVVDPATAGATAVASGVQIWGAAYVPGPGAGLIFSNNGAQLNVSLGGAAPTACCTLSIDGVAGASMTGMAWDPQQQRLLFSRNIAPESIFALPYSADLCTAAPLCTVTPVVAPDGAVADLGGLAFAPDRATLYASNDTAALRGIVSVDLGSGGLSVVAPYPGGQTDIDGLAYHAGRLYLVTDEPGDIFVYDLDAAAYVAPLANPWTTAEVFSAGAFIGFDTIFANGFDLPPVAVPTDAR